MQAAGEEVWCAMDNARINQYREGCSGCGGNGYNCPNLLEKIRQTDFAILDAVLYLDVYPDCSEAVKYIAKKTPSGAN